jgi:2'-5' RNA ligase
MWRPGFSRRAGRMLSLMAKPPAEVAARIAALPRAWPGRPATLLHVTVQPLFDLRPLPDAMLPRIVAWCEGVAAAPLPLSFDRVRETANTVSLRPGDDTPGAAAFHAAVRAGLMRDGFPLMPYRFDPHLTLGYRPDGLGDEAITPIGWTVEELLLVESVVGETRHVVHARLPLRPPPPVVAVAARAAA